MSGRGGEQRSALQTLHDLVGLHLRRSRRPVDVAEDALPAGVAARLALLWAGSRDTALLCGDAGSGDETVQAARRQLLKEAVDRAADVDVLAEITLPVECGGAEHSMRLRMDGDLEALDHPELDLDAELVAASLGGELLPCLRVIDEAGMSWPPAADAGWRRAPVESGELLAFVRLVRSWVGAGFVLASCAVALDAGVQRDQVEGHLSLGMGVATAIQWLDVAPPLARRWVAAGFTPGDASAWTEQGRTLEEAEAAAAVVGGSRSLLGWARVAGRGPSAQALAEWARSGLPMHVWGEAASRGVRALEVPAWLDAGFDAVDMARYAHCEVALGEAVQWRDAGLTSYVAAGCLAAGMTLEQVRATR